MTSRRPQAVAHRQDVRLARLGVARTRRPGRPGALEPAALPAVVLVAAAEHLLELARLARMAAPPEEDTAHRRLVVICGAVATALVADVSSSTSEATTELYLAIVNFQAHRRIVAPEEE